MPSTTTGTPVMPTRSASAQPAVSLPTVVRVIWVSDTLVRLPPRSWPYIGHWVPDESVAEPFVAVFEVGPVVVVPDDRGPSLELHPPSAKPAAAIGAATRKRRRDVDGSLGRAGPP